MSGEEATQTRDQGAVPHTTGLQVARFASTGVLNTVVDFATFNLLVYAFGLAAVPANVLSVSAGITNSYVWNKFWTFKGTNNKAMLGQAAAFIGISLIGLILSTLVLQGLLLVAGPVSAPALNGMKAIAVVVSATWNFMAYKYIVFKR